MGACVHAETLHLPVSIIPALTPLQVVGRGQNRMGRFMNLDGRKRTNLFLCMKSLKKDICKAIVSKAACWDEKNMKRSKETISFKTRQRAPVGGYGCGDKGGEQRRGPIP